MLKILRDVLLSEQTSFRDTRHAIEGELDPIYKDRAREIVMRFSRGSMLLQSGKYQTAEELDLLLEKLTSRENNPNI